MSLALEKFWVDARSDEITIERHPGVGYNRIIGITWRDRNNPDVKIQYILRVPRFDAAPVDNNVAALLFIQRHSKIPAPRVISFDDSQENHLHSPYMVINRLVGSSLNVSFSKLSHQDRRRLTLEIGANHAAGARRNKKNVLCTTRPITRMKTALNAKTKSKAARSIPGVNVNTRPPRIAGTAQFT
ncbi:hypothetical protein F5Y13DRAFT_12745 [Hypoxylon sp. FL1857]|nr:hypothetical protein F5Y13DRAFT_12745 [Hypoxylon sp. FL1857]